MIETKGSELKKLEDVILSLPEKAQAIEVKDKSSLDQAHKMLMYIKGVRKEIDDFCDPNINRLHKAHREAIAQKRTFEQPLVEAEYYIRPQIASYLARLERIRREAEEKRRLEREAADRRAREEEDARLEAAIKAEEKGDLEEAEKILDHEPPVQESFKPQIVIPSKVKLKGFSTRKDWRWELEDFEKVPKEFLVLVINNAKITDYVKAEKEKAKIPGIRIYFKEITVQRNG